MNNHAPRARQNSHRIFSHRRRQAIHRGSDPLWTIREADPARAWLFQALFLVAMTTYIGMSSLTAALSIKLTDVLYVLRIW
jgi:hypothetical protein